KESNPTDISVDKCVDTFVWSFWCYGIGLVLCGVGLVLKQTNPSRSVTRCVRAVFIGCMAQIVLRVVGTGLQMAYPTGVEGVPAMIYRTAYALQTVPPSLQPLWLMYIYQESWKSVLQPATYSRLHRIHTRLIVCVGSLITVGMLVITVRGGTMDFEEKYGSGVNGLFLVLYSTYILTLLGYALLCVSMTVLWVKAYKFRRLLPPTHQPTLFGFKLVTIDAIVVLSFLLSVLIFRLIYLAVYMDSVSFTFAGNMDDDDLIHQYHSLLVKYISFMSIYVVLNPLGLLVLCNLSLLWDSRPQWMRRGASTKRDNERGAELFL
ncbi:hypothetical protein KIPB_009822, partial [Kipferlia bialata]